MKVFTVHVPAGSRRGDPAAFERAVLVRDGFAFFAFLFSVLWFFYHRLWIAGLAILAALLAFGLALDALRINPGAAFAMNVLVAILIGLEANALRRWTWERSGRPMVDVVTARDLEEAERKAYGRWVGLRDASDATAAAASNEPVSAAAAPASVSVPAVPPARYPASESAPGPWRSASGREVIGLFPGADSPKERPR